MGLLSDTLVGARVTLRMFSWQLILVAAGRRYYDRLFKEPLSFDPVQWISRAFLGSGEGLKTQKGCQLENR